VATEEEEGVEAATVVDELDASCGAVEALDGRRCMDRERLCSEAGGATGKGSLPALYPLQHDD
jgi:hypothetical protein